MSRIHLIKNAQTGEWSVYTERGEFEITLDVDGRKRYFVLNERQGRMEPVTAYRARSIMRQFYRRLEEKLRAVRRLVVLS